MLAAGYTQKLVKLRDFCNAQNVEIKVIFCLRDIASHAFSAWRQFVTFAGCVDGWTEFQKFYISEMNVFAVQIEKYAQVF